MLNEIFRNRKIFNKYIKNFDLDAVELVGTGMTSVEALKAVVERIPEILFMGARNQLKNVLKAS